MHVKKYRKMINKLIVDTDNDVELMSQKTTQREYKFMNNNHMREYASPSPIDLSRRRDSVETRKTPSPYNSSNFGSSPPSCTNDSPSTTSMGTAAGRNGHNRSDTPTHHYQNGPDPYCQTMSSYPQMYYPFQPKRETPSPPSTDESLHSHIHHPMDFGKQSSLLGPQTPEEINSYILHAVALQQKLVAQSHQLLPRTDSDESSESMSSTMAMNQSPIASTSSPILKQSQSPPNNSSYPLMMGRDGKLARPFKAYPRNPLVLPATLSAADTILDRTSADKYQMFRKEMLEQIHAANGGQPTITNPRMRRTTVKATQYADTVDQKSHLQQLQQQQQQQQQQLQQQQQQLQQHQQKSNNQISQIQNQQNHLTVDNNNDNDDDMDSRHSDMGSMSKDSAYYERRKKNNAAAKKSRDRRRIKEDEIAIRAAFLERENIELKYELAALKRQLTKYTST